MKTITFITAILIVISLKFSGQVILVPGDEATIQAGIDAAFNHDTVLVAPGEYYENINLKGKNIVLCSNYALSNDQNDILNTIINGSEPANTDTASCILIVSGEDSSAVVQGFTITGGTGTRWEDEHGPGHWYTEGGGILIQYSSPTIRNNMIINNEAINKPAGTTSAGGGAIRCGDGNPHILDNIIANNQGRYGGGIVMNYSGAVIKNNIISGNSGGQDYGGGGLWFLSNGDKPLIVDNNTIVNNTSALGGGGIRLWSSSATLSNNIIWGNTAVTSSQIQGTTGTISYCCIEGGFTGENNIDDDPLFIPNSLILSDESSCIDAGNPGESYNDPEDPINQGYALYPAKGTLRSDMGVYGGSGSVILPDIITGVNLYEESQPVINVRLYPNPASDNITIETNTKMENVSVQLYDSGMIMLRNITDRINIDKNFISKANISDLTPGLYFIVIKSGTWVKVNKFIKE